MSSPVQVTPFLDKLGTLRNPLMVFVILGILIFIGPAYGLAASDDGDSRQAGIRMMYIMAFIFVAAFAFFCYLFVNHPSTRQALMFGEKTAAEIDAHNRKLQEGNAERTDDE